MVVLLLCYGTVEGRENFGAVFIGWPIEQVDNRIAFE